MSVPLPLVTMVAAHASAAVPASGSGAPAAGSPSDSCPIWAHDNLVSEAGGEMYVRGDAVNLRAGPSTDSQILTELGLGTAVTVGACEKKEQMGGRDGCWHSVSAQTGGRAQAGYLYSSALTECRLEVDFDSDGVVEQVYGAVLANGSMQLRVRDPNDAPYVFWEDVMPLHLEYSGTLRVVDASVAGQPLIVVADSPQDYCGGSTNTTYYTYGASGQIKPAISEHYFSDHPLFSELTVEFKPDGTARVVSVQSDVDYGIGFMESVGEYVPAAACDSEQMVCEPAEGALDCETQIQEACEQMEACAAFAMRPRESDDAVDYILYTDGECTEGNGVEDPTWRFFWKEPPEEVVTEQRHEEVLCLQYGQYGPCPDADSWTSPGQLFLFEEGTSSVIRGDADYALMKELGRELTDAERSQLDIREDEQWWVLPREGVARKVEVKRHYVGFDKPCGEEYAAYFTELDDVGDDAVLVLLGEPPASWLAPARRSSISEDDARQEIRKQLPARYRATLGAIAIAQDQYGWHGWIEWQPHPQHPLYRADELDEFDDPSISYQLPVMLDKESVLHMDAPRAVDVGPGGVARPIQRRDINGDGINEVLHAGCELIWSQGQRQVAAGGGNCCGC